MRVYFWDIKREFWRIKSYFWNPKKGSWSRSSAFAYARFLSDLSFSHELCIKNGRCIGLNLKDHFCLFIKEFFMSDYQEISGSIDGISFDADLPDDNIIHFGIEELSYSFTANKVERQDGWTDEEYDAACEKECDLQDRIVKFLWDHLSSLNTKKSPHKLSTGLFFLSRLILNDVDGIEELLSDSIRAAQGNGDGS